MATIPTERLQVGDLVRLGEGSSDEVRIQTLTDPFTMGRNPEYGPCRDATFFDYPGTHRFYGKVTRTGHQPLNKSELARVSSGDVSAPVVQPKSAPIREKLPEPNVEPGESVPTGVMSEVDLEIEGRVNQIRNQTRVVDHPTLPEVVVISDPKVPETPSEDSSVGVQSSDPTGIPSPMSTWRYVGVNNAPEQNSEDDSVSPMVPEIISVRNSSDKIAYVFYSAAALTSVVGSALGAMSKIPWPPGYFTPPVEFFVAAVPVSVIELGGVVAAALGDVRRQLGERALGYRFISGSIAVGAVIWQLYSHDFHWYGWAFGAFSIIAYAMYLLHSASRRRDSLRGKKRMAELAPVYPLWMRIRHPQVVRLATSLAREDSKMTLFESLHEAESELAERRRHRTIAKALKVAIKGAYKDPQAAEIALATYDLNSLAEKIAGNADYEGWAAVISKNLSPREKEEK